MGSFRLFRFFGIDIRAHISFLFLPLFFGLLYGRDHGVAVGLRAFVLIILIFACVLGHELSHSLAARVYGIRVPHITFYAMGGVASMQRIPRKPSQEIIISLVGPFFNFALAAILYFPFLGLLGRETLMSPSLDSWPGTWANLFWVNPVLGAFNLLPAFPMDGGRIFRALLSMRVGRGKATQISAFLGHIFAILFFILGIWYRHWMLLLVGLYIFQAASRENLQTKLEEPMGYEPRN